MLLSSDSHDQIVISSYESQLQELIVIRKLDQYLNALIRVDLVSLQFTGSCQIWFKMSSF